MKKTHPLLLVAFLILTLASCASKPLLKTHPPATVPSLNLIHVKELQARPCAYTDDTTRTAYAAGSQYGLVGALVSSAIATATSSDERALLKTAEKNLKTSGFDLHSEVLKPLEKELKDSGYKLVSEPTSILKCTHLQSAITQEGALNKEKLYIVTASVSCELTDIKGKRIWRHTSWGWAEKALSLKELIDPQIFASALRESCLGAAEGAVREQKLRTPNM